MVVLFVDCIVLYNIGTACENNVKFSRAFSLLVRQLRIAAILNFFEIERQRGQLMSIVKTKQN